MNAAGRTAVAAGVGVAVGLTKRILSQRPAGRDAEDRWLAVTVNRSDEFVGDGALPEPLARFAGRIEVRTRRAAGDKGTELLARPAEDGVSREDLRTALRQAKSLLETGEVLRADSPPSTHPGPAGKALRAVIRRSRGEGRL